MTTTRLKTLLAAICIGGGASIAVAQSIDPIVEVGKQRTASAKASQAKIDRLADETASLLSDYKTVMKQVDGLKVYNARLERQIANQEKRIRDIDASIAEASVIQRQIPPLVTRMLDGLEQFINLDMPFDLDTRLGNIEAVRANMDRSDVTSERSILARTASMLPNRVLRSNGMSRLMNCSKPSSMRVTRGGICR